MNICIKNVLTLMPSMKAEKHSVYIVNDRIASLDAAPENEAFGKVIDGENKILIPGLVNSHTHAYMTLFRNYADDLVFSDWLFKNILPIEDSLTGEDCYWGTLLACIELLSTGTTSFLDMYIRSDSAFEALNDCGMRAVMSRGLSGGADDVEGGKRRIREAAEEIARLKDANPRISFMLAPHAAYSCDEAYLREVAEKANQLGIGLHTHLAEGADETAHVKEHYGCTPTEFYARCGILTENTVAAHCIRLSESDMQLLSKYKTSVATNPVSNLKLANGIAPVPRLLNAGVNVCLGTDGSSSNNALNMFRELSFLCLLHKRNGDALAVTAEQGLRIATENGAKALGLNDCGRIEPGFKADLTLIDLKQPNMQPVNNPVSALAYSANGTETDTVIVDGNILYEHGIFTSIDAERVFYEVEKICKRLGMR